MEAEGWGGVGSGGGGGRESMHVCLWGGGGGGEGGLGREGGRKNTGILFRSLHLEQQCR